MSAGITDPRNSDPSRISGKLFQHTPDRRCVLRV